MKTWDDWSNVDINRAITCIVYNCHGWELTKCGRGYYNYEIDRGGYYTQRVVEFCNSPEEMWPILVENKITVGYDGDGVFASQGELSEFPWVKFDYASGTCTALRAAAIAFLMMNGVTP